MALQPGPRSQVELPGSEVIWYSGDPNIVTVDANGTLTAVGPGNTIVTAQCKKCGTYPDGRTPIGGLVNFYIYVEQPLDVRSLQHAPPLQLPVLVRPNEPHAEPPGLFEMPKMPPQRDDDFNVPMG
jgi:Bacterial Ig-like domain (group 2)